MAKVEKTLITPVAHDFLREDLNELRDKLNAVIEAVNNAD